MAEKEATEKKTDRKFTETGKPANWQSVTFKIRGTRPYIENRLVRFPRH